MYSTDKFKPYSMTKEEEVLKRLQQANEILYPCLDILLKTGGVEYYKTLRDLLEGLNEFTNDVRKLKEE